jgi:hypothetical protein
VIVVSEEELALERWVDDGGPAPPEIEEEEEPPSGVC